MTVMAVSSSLMGMAVIMATLLQVRQGVEEHITKQATQRKGQQDICEALSFGFSFDETHVHAVN
jgi:hypothetical protein